MHLRGKIWKRTTLKFPRIGKGGIFLRFHRYYTQFSVPSLEREKSSLNHLVSASFCLLQFALFDQSCG